MYSFKLIANVRVSQFGCLDDFPRNGSLPSSKHVQCYLRDSRAEDSTAVTQPAAQFGTQTSFP